MYYWWWEYLKRNEQYLATCEAGGDGELAALYADFGDVRGDSFKEWWSAGDRGALLFADSVEERVRILATGEAALDDKEYLTLSLPLYLPKRFLEKRIKALLDERHKGQRGRQHAKKSKAKYRVQGQPNVPALRQGLIVYDYWKAHPELSLWEIGHNLPAFQMEHKIKENDTQYEKAAKKNRLAATVGRYIKRVKTSIENTGRGMFP